MADDGTRHTVPSSEYELTLKSFEDEKRAHASTRRHLADVQDKLSLALGQVELLTRQLEREKRQFQQTFGNLKNRALTETVRNVELENKCNVISHEHEIQSDALAEREDAIASLTQTVQLQRDDFSHMLSEQSLQRKQQLYIAQALGKTRKDMATNISGRNLPKT